VSVLLDACAVISHLCDEPAADEVDQLLRAGDVAMTAVTVAEVIDRMARLHGQEPDDVEARLVMLGVEVEPVPADLAVAAGRVRSECYHRKQRPVSLADCVAAVAALGDGHTLATSDAALATVGDELGVIVRPLLNSQGERPLVSG
jgi:predicted nucleic acid-binding protein